MFYRLDLQVCTFVILLFNALKFSEAQILTSSDRDRKDSSKSSYRQYQGDEGISSMDKILLSAFQEVNVTSVCEKEVRLFLRQLSKKKGWALEMFDASAKLSSGLFSGNVKQLGEYDQCVGIQTVDDDDSAGAISVNGRYCLVLVDVSAGPHASMDLMKLVHRIRGENLLVSNINDTGHFIPRFSTIHVGVCIPAGCSAAQLEATLKALKRHFIPNELDLEISVKDELCYSKSEGDLPQSAINVLVFYFVTLVIAIFGTILDLRMVRKFFGNPDENVAFAALTSFSLTRNFKTLLQNKEDDLPSIHGIRAVCTLMLFFAHKIIILCMTPYTNRHAFIQDSQLPITALFRSSMIYTDTFLLLSGVLSSYNFCKEIQRNGRIAWLNRSITRFMRLTPAFLAIILYYAYLMEHMGSGPQWAAVIKPNADLCKKNMIWNLFYIHNLFPFQEMCITQSHQLAIDTQLFLITPALIYLLYNHHVVGLVVILTANIGSTLLRYFITLSHSLSLVIHYGVTVGELYKTANLCYSQTLHRATPYLFGVYTGFIVHKHKSGASTKDLPLIIVYTMRLTILMGLIWPIWQLAHMSDPDYQFNVHESANYSALSPLVWAFAMSLLIYCCCFGYAGPVQNLLNSRALAFLSKISYTVFLTQFAVFFHRLASVRSTQFYSKSDLIVAEEILLVLGVSLMITLLYDCPVHNIRAILVRGKKEEKTVFSKDGSNQASKTLKFSTPREKKNKKIN